MTITLNALQKQRRDTASNWTSNNTVLLAGELGYESDTKKFKIGDGTTAWQSLDYIPIPDTNRLLAGNLTVGGNFTVNGTTTTIDTTTLTVEDKNIEIGKVTTPSDTTADGGGITLKGATDKTINWVDSTDSWTLSEHLDLASGKVLKVAGTEILSATTLGSSVVSSSLTSVGTIATGVWNGTAIAKSNLASLDIVNADVNASAAIAGSKINPVGLANVLINTTQAFDSLNGRGNLVVGSGSGNEGMTIYSGTSNTGGIVFADGISGTAAYMGQIAYEHSNNSMVFKVNEGGTRMTIDSSGNVGIGTTSISNKFHVKHTDYQVARFENTNADANGSYIEMYANSASPADNDTVGLLNFKGNDDGGNETTYAQIKSLATDVTNGSEDGAITFGTRLDGTFAERMRIDSNGRVGIGTTSPTTPLSVGDSFGNVNIVGYGILLERSSATTNYVVAPNADAELYISADEAIRFGTVHTSDLVSTERMRIDESGRVGIGTTSMSCALHVKHATNNELLRLESGDQYAHMVFKDSGSTSDVLLGADGNDLRINTGGSERMRIDSSGNVKVVSGDIRVGDDTDSNAGTQTISVGSVSSGSGGIGIFANPTNGNSFLQFGDGTASADQYRGFLNYQHASDNLNFGTAGSERMRLTSEGKLCIGTTSPNNSATNLHVENSGENNVYIVGNTSNAGARIMLQNKSTTANSHVGVLGTDASGNTTAQVLFYSVSDNTNEGFMTFETRPANGLPSERMRIDSDGRVGIGNNNPSSLHSSGENLVVGSGSGEEGMTIYSGATSSGVINFADGTSGSQRYEGRIIYSHNNNHMTFHVKEGGERMRLISNGRLFLGCTGAININSVTTGHTFQQVDDFKWVLGLRCEQTDKVGLAIRYAAGGNDHDALIFVKDTTIKFRVNSAGDCSNANNSFTQVSDLNLKENIVDANSQWNDIKNIKIRNWNFKSSTGYDTHTQIGVVAQEIETVSPNVVKTNEDGLKEVVYSVLNIKALKCLQEAIAKIEVLETKVAALEAA